MAGASGSILPVETTEQTQARVSTALAPLTGVLGNIERFSVEAIINSNLTVDIFLKAIKSLVAYAQQDILENIASAANTAGAIQHVINMTPKDLFDLSRWVKTAAGMEAISKITTQRRLLRQGGAGRSASQVAWVNLFTQQQADYAQEKKRKMTRFERKREDLKLQLAQLDTDEAASMERLAAKYPTQVALPATMETELVAACWAAYVADCDRRGITPSAKTNASLTEAVKHYSANVRDQILTTYCEQENVQADLTRYAREKIQSFRDSGNQGGVTRVRNLYTAATGAAIDIPPPRAQEVPHETGPVRDPIAQTGEAQLQAVAHQALTGVVIEADPDRAQGEASSGDSDRASAASTESTRRLQPDRRVKKPRTTGR
ncbi:ORF1 [Blueberry latent virus]|uniref:ORF1 n=1 Tax=Blueberry latent virus TaxID=430710 RepID=D1D8L7_9VIRU|nr:ORF1 [Blueberry latent virus]ACZ49979.1 ORF1 [Blueberry latent virus]ADO14115.1 ORF1 [Blueberry latent virus]ADO14119.1 ORF1 [Blueberry latent virus]QJF74569.1 ORF1 [Blueberry latent virus]UIP65106.1 ORF1 [Blueberry latent virus]